VSSSAWTEPASAPSQPPLPDRDSPAALPLNRAGSIRDEPASTVVTAPKSSLPVERRRTSAAAALNALWPEGYSANGGVTTVVSRSRPPAHRWCAVAYEADRYPGGRATRPWHGGTKGGSLARRVLAGAESVAHHERPAVPV
jgi:hypothetical protein